ncbi:MAG: amino acid ABC transporter permease [Vulcanimicrobiaceae bacterium]
MAGLPLPKRLLQEPLVFQPLSSPNVTRTDIYVLWRRAFGTALAIGLDFHILVPAAPAFAHGIGVTVEITAIATAGSLVVGMVGAAMRTLNNKIAGALATAFTEFFRNTPPLVQMYFLYFGLPLTGVRLSSLLCGIIALTIYQGAIGIELLRSGLEAVPSGQHEAAQALGLASFDQMASVIAPQAIRISLPAMSNNIISLLKNSAIVSAIGVADITGVANDLIAINFRTAEYFVAIGALYLLMAWSISVAFKIVERRLAMYA